MVITELNPGNKPYKIVKMRKLFFCQPKIKEDELELLWCFNGNNLIGHIDLSWLPFIEIPNNLTVDGSLDLSYTNLENYPLNLTVNGPLTI